MELPEPAVAAIVRGVGAYIQVARPTDLPSKLRSLRGKHQKMLNARRKEIVSALDDEAFRAMVIDWLEDKPIGIAKPDAAILDKAARREDGWVEALAGEVPLPKKKTAAKDPNESLEREKARTRKAKEEARKAKEDATSALAAQRKEASALQGEVGSLRARVTSLEKDLAAAERQRAAAIAEAEREVRKARKRAEKAIADLDAEKAKAKRLRTELAEAKAKSQPPVPRKTRTTEPKVRAVAEPQRRRKLPVPKGRYGDDPETLKEWISTPHVHLLVDGYNVSKAEGGFGDLTLETQRQRLLQEVGKLARRHEIAATVIFDGSSIAPGTSRRHRGPVEVEYSRPDEIADDHLIAKLEGLPKHPVVVATNDRELQNRAARLGATVATSNQLLGLIR